PAAPVRIEHPGATPPRTPESTLAAGPPGRRPVRVHSRTAAPRASSCPRHVSAEQFRQSDWIHRSPEQSPDRDYCRLRDITESLHLYKGSSWIGSLAAYGVE